MWCRWWEIYSTLWPTWQHAWHTWSLHTSTFVVVIHSTIAIAIHARKTLARFALARHHLAGFGSLPKVWTIMATN
jgi:hypothetical protein